VTRLDGATRFATAAAISRATFSPGVPVVYIAYAYNFPDALAAAAAAGTRQGPILYVDTSGPIEADTAAELTRLQPQTIDVLGGTAVISEAVKTALGPYLTGP
jgi:putative cell wall-binding protein